MFYLAYGSNLNIEQMGYRCPDAVPVTTAVIQDYRLMYKGSKSGAYLTIESEVGSSVPVAVWRVTEADRRSLDAYEGYPAFYYRKEIKVKCADGRFRNCFVYIMHEDRRLAIPSDWYVATCRQGYNDFGLDQKVLDDAYLYTWRKIMESFKLVKKGAIA